MNQPAQPVSRRIVMAGWAGIGAAALVGAKFVNAQESTPAAEDSTDPATTDATDQQAEIEARAAAFYATFLESMATNLGVADTTTVDTAIRDSLKSVVDELFAAGEISANFAEERKTAIDEAVVPIAIGGASLWRGSEGRMERHGRSMRPNSPFGRGGDDDEVDLDVEESDEPMVDGTPTT